MCACVRVDVLLCGGAQRIAGLRVYPGDYMRFVHGQVRAGPYHRRHFTTRCATTTTHDTTTHDTTRSAHRLDLPTSSLLTLTQESLCVLFCFLRCVFVFVLVLLPAGGVLIAKGFDSLVRPEGKEHLDPTTLKGKELMEDGWLQVRCLCLLQRMACI